MTNEANQEPFGAGLSGEHGKARKKTAKRKKTARKAKAKKTTKKKKTAKKKRSAKSASRKRPSAGGGELGGGGGLAVAENPGLVVPDAWGPKRSIPLTSEGSGGKIKKKETPPATLPELGLIDPSAEGTGDERNRDALDWMEKPSTRRRGLHDGANAEELLLAAAEQGDIEKVELLIDRGVDAKARDKRRGTHGWTALMLAARSGAGDVARVLLKAGLDPEATDDPTGAHKGIVRFLCRRQGLGEMNKSGIRRGRTACHIAAAHGQTDVVRALIEKSCNVNAADHAGKTPLMLAVRAGFLTLARLLIQAGAKVDAHDAAETHVLSLAARAGTTELARLLVDSGADVDVHDARRTTPLMAAVAGAHSHTVRALLKAGADVRRQDQDGFGVLCYAIHAVERFEDDNGVTGIRPLAEKRVLWTVQTLLDAGAIDQPDGTGVLPSRRAEEQGYERVAELLRTHRTSAAA